MKAVHILLGLIILLCAQIACAIEESYLIVPGKCIGKVCIGDKPGDVSKTLGVPHSTRTGKTGLRTNIWKNRKSSDYLFVTYEHGKVADVQITSPKFRTTDGISTNSPLPMIKSKYPDGKADEYAVFSNGHGRTDWSVRGKGITFTQADQSEAIIRIAVYVPGKEKLVGYSDDDWFWHPR